MVLSPPVGLHHLPSYLDTLMVLSFPVGLHLPVDDEHDEQDNQDKQDSTDQSNEPGLST